MSLFHTILAVVAAVAVLLSGVLAYSNYKYAGELAEARALVQEHVKAAKEASAESARAELVAADEKAQADAATKSAAEHAAQARLLEKELASVRAQLPAKITGVDTTAVALTSTINATDIAIAMSDSWHQAYENQLQATAHLQTAIDTLLPALQKERAASQALQGSATKLVDASHRSFWDKLVPKVGVGAAAGVNAQGKPDAVVGVTLSYGL